MGWLPEIASFIRDSPKRRPFSDAAKKKTARLGILALETAKTMSRLLSLYKSLSDEELSRLKNDVVRSEGVAFLTSSDEELLLSLACAERLEDLDRVAGVVSRLGEKCSESWLNRFDLVFTDFKLGVVDYGKLEYGSRYAERKVLKMEKLVSPTACLHSALEVLTEMEVTERKLKQRKNREGENQSQNSNPDLFYQKLEHQRKEIHHLKSISLWRKTFDKSISLMATIVMVIYTRIYFVFKPYISVLPSISSQEFTLFQQIKEHIPPHSGHTVTQLRPTKLRIFSRKSDILFNDCDSFAMKNSRVFHAAGPSTVGGSGLALHYANVILLVEKYLDSSASMGPQERESLYLMLPENLKALVKAKLCKNMKSKESDEFLAEGWRAAMVEILKWLIPMANDTVKWQLERNVDKMKFDSKPLVLLLQTLHFADKVKTEAAIAEVLVGLSCVYRFENRRLCVDSCK
ncbi:hypothetical protein ACS0TY_015934 [Phlomoides rotata]